MDPSTVLKLTAASTTMYSAQMIAAPSWSNEFYYKKGHKESPNWIRWFGHGLAGMAVAQGLASQEKTPNKAVLMASAAQYLTAPVMMAIQKDDFKPEMIAVNGALCLGMGALCLKAAKDN